MSALKQISKKWLALGFVVIFTAIVVASVMYRSPTTPKASTTSDIEFLGNVTRIGFAYIKDANYDFDPKKPAPPVPVVLKNLEGKQVEITGYAMPLYNPDGKAEFFLTQAGDRHRAHARGHALRLRRPDGDAREAVRDGVQAPGLVEDGRLPGFRVGAGGARRAALSVARCS